MNTISFDVVLAPSVGDDGQVGRRAWVVANIDGQVLGGSGTPVSFHDLLAHRGLNSELEVLTCSCGVAGCAGFHQDVQQQWSAEQVIWRFDAQEYAGYFLSQPCGVDGAKEVVVTFATEHLSNALDALQTRIAELLLDGPMHLIPGYDEEPLASTDELDADVAAQRAWYLNRVAREARHAEIFGPLAEQWVRAAFRNGALWQANVAEVLNNVLKEEADSLGLQDQGQVDEYVEQQVLTQWRPRLWANMEPLLELVKAPSPDSIVRHCFRPARRAESPNTGELTLDALWATAAFSVADSAL